ncbi:putative nudix domain-containing protein [Botrytis fragariae]|uniref:Putative nudix domain-containing protein n=1 Tax=Botrytis fragariae TaxID=1964551 RepID=A0A8H6B345_9HELO|nr:putative nudix domain-containing protein [Botrytis fragariae]KAF5878240.1 putative nudix domain-containing protein [Botrytis fragariae]
MNEISKDSKLSPESSIQIEDNEVAELQQSILEAQYFDASSMAPLSAASIGALARLRAYKPPPFDTVWNLLPLSRRAAVLVLLFADRRGDLRVVITMRSTTLRNFSGQAAFPGGKADALSETPFEIARREASEEIGLPRYDHKIPAPFRIEHLCQLPFSLARTALAVRPCVAFLHADNATSGREASVGEDLMPRLDAREVAAVFSAPFHNFLRMEDEVRKEDESLLPGKKSDWYSGAWHEWHDTKWRMHNFYVPITNQKVSRPKVREGGQAAIAEELEEQEEQGLTRFKVWGMTARMLVDAARIAYEQEPEFEHNAHVGDEELIAKLQSTGHLEEKKNVSVAEIVDARNKIKEEKSGAKM